MPSRAAFVRFLREADVLRSLDHPHIVRFQAMGESAGQLWFAMDFVDGPDLQRLVDKRGPLEVPVAVRMARQLLDALDHAHHRGFVHRDVKPTNLMLQRTGANKVSLRLTDFGLARTYQASRISGLTQVGESGGTPRYMPPEQVQGFKDATPKSDQYSAAATLYFLLTGKTVYNSAGSVQAAYIQILTEDPVPVRSRRPELPEALAAVIHRGLARQPADRYPDAASLARALEPFMSASGG